MQRVIFSGRDVPARYSVTETSAGRNDDNNNILVANNGNVFGSD